MTQIKARMGSSLTRSRTLLLWSPIELVLHPTQDLKPTQATNSVKMLMTMRDRERERRGFIPYPHVSDPNKEAERERERESAGLLAESVYNLLIRFCTTESTWKRQREKPSDYLELPSANGIDGGVI